MQKFLVEDMRTQPNIYASHHKIEVPLYLAQAAAQAIAVNRDGALVIPAGTVYPSNDANAKGIIVNDYDVSYNDLVGAMCVHGAILESKLPKKIAAAAKTALNQIVFVEPKALLEDPTLVLGGTVQNVKAADIPDAGLDVDVILRIQNAEFRLGYSDASLISDSLISLVDASDVAVAATKAVVSSAHVEKDLAIIKVHLLQAATADTIKIKVLADLINRDIAPANLPVIIIA